ncbi:MAG: alpha/beta hydrolase [Ornithinimicrobium sp.]
MTTSTPTTSSTAQHGRRPDHPRSRLASGPGFWWALLGVAAAGAVIGWWLPRGPVTSVQAVTVLLLTVLLGVAVGWATRTRLALLATPVVYLAAFEAARARVEGPTVDGVHLGDAYGVLAFFAGRGVDALLMLFPLTVAVGVGLAVAARRGLRARPSWPARIVLIVSVILVALLGAALLRPASTDAITGPDGEPVPDSIAELVEVEIGGHEQSIMLRGRDVTAPVLLFLEGGPGGTAIGRIRNAGTDLEEDFVVATWDQRGSGKSYDALEPVSTLTLEQMVRDTVQVSDYLRGRFDQDKIYLVGSSWGTVIGVLAVQRAPQDYHAYIGTGQMVDPFQTDQLMYAESLADAREAGQDGRVEQLLDLGPPPYESTLSYPIAIASNPKWMNFEHGADYNPASEYPFSLMVGEYTLIEQLRGMAAIAETYSILYPQLAPIDFRSDVPSLDVPVHLVQGVHEAAGREVLAREWFELLEAPTKEYVALDQSGHTPPYDEPGRFANMMAQIAAETSGP